MIPSASSGAGKSPGKSKVFLVGGGIFVVVILLVAGVLVLGGGGSAGGNGPIADETGFVTDGSLQAAPASAPTDKVWSKDCDGTCSIVADPSHLFVLDSTDDEATVAAYDKSDGKQSWRADIDGGSSEVLALAGDTLLISGYPGSSFTGEESKTTAFLTDDGTKRWSEDGVSLAGLGTSSTVLLSTSDEDGRTKAVDVRSGDERWSHGGTPVGVCDGHALLMEHDASGDSGDITVVSARRYEVYDLSSGDQQNSVEADEDSNEATCSNAGVFVRDGDQISAYSFTDHERRWKTDVNDASGVSAAAGLVFVNSGDDKVEALDADKGEKRWSSNVDQSSDDDGASYFFVLALSGGRVLVTTDETEELLKTSDGSVIASHDEWPAQQKFCPVGDAVDTYDDSGETTYDTTPTEPDCDQEASSQGTSADGLIETKDNSVRLVGWSNLDVAWTADLADVDEADGISDVAVGGGQLYVVTGASIQAYR